MFCDLWLPRYSRRPSAIKGREETHPAFAHHGQDRKSWAQDADEGINLHKRNARVEEGGKKTPKAPRLQSQEEKLFFDGRQRVGTIRQKRIGVVVGCATWNSLPKRYPEEPGGE